MAIVTGIAGLCASLFVASAARDVSADPADSPTSDPTGSVSEPAALDVPFVPQSELLCGGAALAMVFRYWGDTETVSEDFASSLDAGGRGILAHVLAEAAETRGWVSRAWHADPDEVRQHLSDGRPIIALIDGRSSTLHYVVLTAWSRGQVIYHDPAINPARSMQESDFVRVWDASRRWALLVVPREPVPSTEPVPSRAPRENASSSMDVREQNDGTTPRAQSRADSDRSNSKVVHAVQLAKEGKLAEARSLLRAAHAEQPDEADPLRELAGLAFLEAEWDDAGRLASEALERDPADSLTRRILAGSRFLEGDVQSALESWNCLQEPRLDLAEVQGSDQIRYRTITDQLGFRHDELVTSRSFRRAERRLREIPAVSQSRISLVPAPHGRARLEVVVSERLLFPRDSRSLMWIGARSAVTREFQASAASLTGNGELWTVQGRWSKERPLVALSLSIPNPRGRPGIWRIESMWERQAFLPEELVAGEFALRKPAPRELTRLASDGDSTRIEIEGRLVREERRRSSLSFSDWILPDVRLSIGAALDRWNRAVHFVALQDEVEIRLARDHLAWTTWGSAWIPFRSSAAGFTAASTGMDWESSGIERADSWRAHVALHTASRHAPFSVWPGAAPSLLASGGAPEAAPVRAHPRLQNDIVQAERMSPSRWSSGLEKRIFPWSLGFLRVGMAAFVDAAGPLGSHPGPDARWQVDSGVGLLIREIGSVETVRLDLAHGLRDGAWALSLSWHADRRN